MTALAINLIALLIVLGLCWTAMMWLSGRFHGQPRGSVVEYDDASVTREAEPDPTIERLARAASEAPCTLCEGVGAQNTHGQLRPCSECYGTGVLT